MAVDIAGAERTIHGSAWSMWVVPAMLNRMEPDTLGRRELLDRAVEHASDMSSLFARLAEDRHTDATLPSLQSAAQAEFEALRTLAASGDCSLEACKKVSEHLEHLEVLLIRAVGECADSSYALADRIAVAEEFKLDRALGQPTSADVVALGDELAALRSSAFWSGPGFSHT